MARAEEAPAGFTSWFSTASTWGWGLKAGPKKDTRAGAPSEQGAIPGEFVSDQLRDDCARFLDDLRTTIDRRRETPPERRADWVPRGRE
jgi:hypothetical protein